MLKQDFARPGDNGKLVYEAKGGDDVRSPAVQEAVVDVARQLAAQPHVLCVNTLYGPPIGKAPPTDVSDSACNDPTSM